MINQEKYPELTVIPASQLTGNAEFALDFSTESWSVFQFLERPAIFLFNDPLQREEEAWTMEKASEAIVSILMQISLGPIKAEVVRRSQKRYRNVLDGVQRMTRVRDYVKNKWALTEECFMLGQNDHGELILIDLSNLFFKDLPEVLQKRILTYNFTVECYELNGDEKLKKELFYRWNNGEPLTHAEKKKAFMNDELLVNVAQLMNSEIFRTGFSPLHVKRSLHLESILQVIAVLQTDNNTAISEWKTNEMLKKEKFSSEAITLTKEVTNFLQQVFDLTDEKNRKKVFHKTKRVSLYYVASKARLLQESPAIFLEWAQKFYLEDIKESGFFNHSGTVNLDKVKARNDIPLNHYQNFRLNMKAHNPV